MNDWRNKVSNIAIIIALVSVLVSVANIVFLKTRRDATDERYETLIKERGELEILELTLKRCKESGGRLFTNIGTGIHRCEWTPNEGLDGQ